MLGSFSEPEKNIEFLHVPEGGVVADFGSGSGHYVFPLAKRLGENGTVYAIDIQKGLLSRLDQEAKAKNIKTIHTIWGNVEEVGGSKLRSGILDAAILSNILFQVDSKAGLLHEAHRVLKPGGEILLIDWSESFGGLGPEPKAVVDETTAIRLAEQSGFRFVQEVFVGDHHYGVLFQKAS